MSEAIVRRNGLKSLIEISQMKLEKLSLMSVSANFLDFGHNYYTQQQRPNMIEFGAFYSVNFAILSLEFLTILSELGYPLRRPSFARGLTKSDTMATLIVQEQKGFIRLSSVVWVQGRSILMTLWIIYRCTLIYITNSFEKSLNMVNRRRELIFKIHSIASFMAI